MAVIRIPSQDRTLDDRDDMRAFLADYGIQYECWPLTDRVDPDADPAEILKTYAAEIELLKMRGGYTAADVINVTPRTPGLEEMLNRFNKEHRHADDEVRFIIKGRGIFHVNPATAPVFAIQVEGGDMINVPAGTRHWFDLCADRLIRAIRLFKDPSGWSPQYVENGVHGDYAPLCWGPTYIPGQTVFRSTVLP